MANNCHQKNVALYKNSTHLMQDTFIFYHFGFVVALFVKSQLLTGEVSVSWYWLSFPLGGAEAIIFSCRITRSMCVLLVV